MNINEEFVCNAWYQFKQDEISYWMSKASAKDIDFFNMLNSSPFYVMSVTSDDCIDRIETIDGTCIDCEDFDQWCILNDSDKYALEKVDEPVKTKHMSIKSKLELIEKLLAQIKAEL